MIYGNILNDFLSNCCYLCFSRILTTRIWDLQHRTSTGRATLDQCHRIPNGCEYLVRALCIDSKIYWDGCKEIHKFYSGILWQIAHCDRTNAIQKLHWSVHASRRKGILFFLSVCIYKVYFVLNAKHRYFWQISLIITEILGQTYMKIYYFHNIFYNALLGHYYHIISHLIKTCRVFFLPQL